MATHYEYTVTNTADAGAGVVVTDITKAGPNGWKDLRKFFVQLVVEAAAGTWEVECKIHPDADWAPHTAAGLDATAPDIVSGSAGPSEVYFDFRVTLTGTGGTNNLYISMERRER